MRTFLIGVLLAIPVLNLAVLAWAVMTIRAFLARIPSIDTPSQLEEYRALGARHARVGAFLKPLLGLPSLIWIGALFLGELEFWDILYAVLPGLVVIVAGLGCQGTEKRMNEIPTKDELRAERDRIAAAS